MKKFLAISLVFIISICSVPVSTFASSAGNTAEEIITPGPDNPERIIYSYEKSVTVFYPSLASIPSTYAYREYNEEYMAWFSGTLTFTKAVTAPGGYLATFKGQLVGTL